MSAKEIEMIVEKIEMSAEEDVKESAEEGAKESVVEETAVEENVVEEIAVMTMMDYFSYYFFSSSYNIDLIKSIQDILQAFQKYLLAEIFKEKL